MLNSLDTANCGNLSKHDKTSIWRQWCPGNQKQPFLCQATCWAILINTRRSGTAGSRHTCFASEAFRSDLDWSTLWSPVIFRHSRCIAVHQQKFTQFSLWRLFILLELKSKIPSFRSSPNHSKSQRSRKSDDTWHSYHTIPRQVQSRLNLSCEHFEQPLTELSPEFSESAAMHLLQ